MKKMLALLAVTMLAVPAAADVFLPGEFTGWDNTFPMPETAPGSGIYSHDVVDFVDGDGLPTKFLFLSEAGNWDAKYIPSGDQWLIMDPATDDITVTFDMNTYDDGWFPVTNRVGLSYEHGEWIAAGDLLGWDNGNMANLMTPLGGGIYSLTQTGVAEGWHAWKAVRPGTWDAIGGDSRSMNADNFDFEVTAGMDTVTYYVNALEGTLKVEVTPEPTTLALLGLGGLVALRRRR